MALAFALAWRRLSVGWPLANPLHVLGGSLWLGTLFVLVVCGLGQMLRPSVPATERERVVAEGGALKIRRTASTELAFAALVLLLTAILVSLLSPKAQKRSTASWEMAPTTSDLRARGIFSAVSMIERGPMRPARRGPV